MMDPFQAASNIEDEHDRRHGDPTADIPCHGCDESDCTDDDGMMHPDICDRWNDWSERQDEEPSGEGGE